MILARLKIVEGRLETIEAKLDEIVIQKAASDGESRALAKIGGWVVVIFGGVGGIVAWFTTGGEGWLRDHLK